MRRHPFKKTKSNLHEFFRWFRLEAFSFQILPREGGPTISFCKKDGGQIVQIRRWRYTELCRSIGKITLTSIPKSSSIFMTLPKIVIYCIRFANSQQFRRRFSKPFSSGRWSGAPSTSERVRFRDTMAAIQDRSRRRSADGSPRRGEVQCVGQPDLLPRFRKLDW